MGASITSAVFVLMILVETYLNLLLHFVKLNNSVTVQFPTECTPHFISCSVTNQELDRDEYDLF